MSTTFAKEGDLGYSKGSHTLESLNIGNQHPCFIIAEIGQNHQGEIQNAKELIRLAKV
jgi:sialic acid synthase SpsE